MAIGQLLLPTVILDWGDISLDRAFSSVSMSLRTDNEGNDLSISFDPSVIGYEKYRQCVSEENRPKSILATFGYAGGNSITGEFLYSGVSIGSGSSPEITVSAMSKSVSFLNRFRLNKTFGDGTTELDLPSLLKLESRYRGVRLDTSEVGHIGVNHASITGETTAEFTLRELSSRGLSLSVPHSPTHSGHDIKIEKPYASDPEIVEEASITDTNRSDSKRLAYFISLTSLQDFSRTVQYTAPTRSNSTTSSSSVTSASLVDSKDGEKVKEVSPSASGSEGESEPKVEGGGAEKSTSSESSLDLPSTSSDIDTENTSEERFRELVRECSGSIFMSPRLTGLRPKDFILLPSIKGDYAEDWEVTSVTYQLDNGGITLSFTGRRWSSDDPMLLNYSELLSKLNNRSSIEEWISYYWVK